jgi:CubicO group peptidase (beta-lactamase class C family)
MLLSLFTCLIALRALIPPGDSTVQRLARERVESNRNVGIVIGIIDSIGRRRLFQFGKATDDASAPLGANTVFEIGSVTKTFTAALLEQMVEHDEVSLDEPASTLLPADVHVAAHGREITRRLRGDSAPRVPLGFRAVA